MEFRIDCIRDDQVGIDIDEDGNAYVRMPDQAGHGLEVMPAPAEPLDQDTARKRAIAEATAIGQAYIPVGIADPHNWTGEGAEALTP